MTDREIYINIEKDRVNSDRDKQSQRQTETDKQKCSDIDTERDRKSIQASSYPALAQLLAACPAAATAFPTCRDTAL